MAFCPSFVTSALFASVEASGSDDLASHRPCHCLLLGMASSGYCPFVDQQLIRSFDRDLRHLKVKLHDYYLEYFPSVMEAP